MATTRPPTTDVSHKTSPKTPRIVWWIVGGILLCFGAIVFAVWWPAHVAYRLVDDAEQNQGEVTIFNKHPLWMKDIISEEKYLPWYDEVSTYTLREMPISPEVLQDLPRLKGLRNIEVDISDCPPESLDALTTIELLNRVNLRGNEQPISLDWVQDCPNLEHLSLSHIPVSSDEWPSILAMPNLHQMRLERNRIWFDNQSSDRRVQITVDEQQLGRAEAEAMNAVADLEILYLFDVTTDAEFWETLGRNQTLTWITVSDPIPPSDLAQLEKIPTLTALAMYTPCSTENFPIFPRLKRLESISLDLKGCSPESIRHLGRCENLQTVGLSGDGKPIPFDWTASCTSLNYLRLSDIPVPAEKWPELLALPNINGIHIWTRALNARHSILDVPPHLTALSIEDGHLGRAEAEAIDTAALDVLALDASLTNDEFWTTLGQNETLSEIRVKGPLPPFAIEQLARIATLKTLILIPSAAHPGSDPHWAEFRTQRPDVDVR